MVYASLAQSVRGKSTQTRICELRRIPGTHYGIRDQFLAKASLPSHAGSTYARLPGTMIELNESDRPVRSSRKRTLVRHPSLFLVTLTQGYIGLSSARGFVERLIRRNIRSNTPADIQTTSGRSLAQRLNPRSPVVFLPVVARRSRGNGVKRLPTRTGRAFMLNAHFPGDATENLADSHTGCVLDKPDVGGCPDSVLQIISLAALSP